MEKYLLSKMLAISVIILFVGTCIVPNVSSIISKEDTLSYDQLDYSGLWTHPDETQYGIINSFNIWEPKHRTYRNTYHAKDFSIKSNDPKYVKKSPMTNSNGKTLYVGGSGPGNYSSIHLAIYLASDGDTVFVYSGTYYIRGSGITIDKSISLIGENRETTIIDSLPTTWVAPLIKIARTTNGVTISGFTFQNSVVLMLITVELQYIQIIITYQEISFQTTIVVYYFGTPTLLAIIIPSQITSSRTTFMV